MTKPEIIEIIRSVPIAGKTYEEYVEALADRIYSEELKEIAKGLIEMTINSLSFRPSEESKDDP